MEFIDIGFNLTSSAFRKDEADVVARATQAGVTKFIVTGSNVADSQSAVELTNKYQNMYATTGVHPHLAKEWEQNTTSKLQALAQSKHVVAIGETGLDYNRNYSHPKQQRQTFESQLALAAELELPVFLHERDAHDDFIEILTKYKNSIAKAVVHCFTGTAEHLKAYLELDCHIGITGWICDERRGQHLHSIISNIPNNRLMIETDAPYLLPRDLPDEVKPNNRRNEPQFLPHIAQAIARARDTSLEQIAQQTTQTAIEFFNIH